MRIAKYSQLADRLVGGGGWADEDTYESLTPRDGQEKPTLAALEAVRAEVEAILNAPPPKTWPGRREFDAEFTDTETYGIEVSNDPTIVVLRARLNRWEGPVVATDDRVQTAIDRLVEIGILTQARADTILSPATP